MQKIQIIGNIGNDAKIDVINGNKYINFSVCVNSSYKDKDGVKVQSTFWYNILKKQVEGKLAQYLLKGTKIFVFGDFSLNLFKAKDNTTKASLNVFANHIELLGNSKKEETATSEKKETTEVSEGAFSENVPF